jgi:hypothetical protein
VGEDGRDLLDLVIFVGEFMQVNYCPISNGVRAGAIRIHYMSLILIFDKGLL